MRFRKSIKLLPGAKLNLSKSGVSASIGPKGATVNLSPGKKTRITAGIPGTGLSHTESIGSDPSPMNLPAPDGPPPPLWLSVARSTWSGIQIVGVFVLAVAGVILLVLTLGGSKRK